MDVCVYLHFSPNEAFGEASHYEGGGGSKKKSSNLDSRLLDEKCSKLAENKRIRRVESKKSMSQAGIEPTAHAWKARMLPLHHCDLAYNLINFYSNINFD